jgi:hypothetical protein
MLMSEHPTHPDLELKDIVSVLNGEDLAGYPSRFQTDIGKFVVVARHVLVAPHIRYGDRGKSLMHADIYDQIRFGGDYPEISAEMLEESIRPSYETTPKGRSLGINDAGSFGVSVRGGVLSGLIISGESGSYGRASKLGRMRTIDLCQEVLGDTVRIQNI